MAKALFIVEGAILEPRFFTRMSEVYGLNLDIVPLRANIYLLYQKLKDYGFDYDVRIALKELVKEEESLQKLAGTYAYTYLVFDCDAHHCGLPRAGEPIRDIAVTVNENYKRLAEMLQYFTDETDPERGRLFINYPMMESYRDCDSFVDESFKDRVVGYADLSNYKRFVGERKMASRRIDSLVKDDFGDLTRQNLGKVAYLLGVDCPLSDLVHNVQEDLLKYQRELVAQRIMSVVNTSVFVVLDYKVFTEIVSDRELPVE